jgi:uncharacterized YccA/Bax inhibitor family protein
MLKKISKLIPAISLLVVAILSLFNVGYFWRFGVHYLGVVDLSNLIYSFGLALVAISLLSFFVPAIVHHFSKGSSAQAALGVLRVNAVLLSFAAFVGWLVLFNPGHIFDSHVASDGVMLASICIGLVVLSSKAWIRYKHLGSETPAQISFIAVLAMIGVIGAGLFAGDLAAIGRETYSIVTKQQTIENARIIRSSSSGFVLLVDGKAMFVPQSEIITVKSNLSPSERQ